MGNINTNNKLIIILFILISSPLIINGYPILNMDSSINILAYNNITSLLSPPPARPIFYSLYFFISSIGKTSVLLPCLIQDFIAAFLISKIFDEFGIQDRFLFTIGLIYLPLSYLAIMSNAIMTDIWLGLAFLSSYLFTSSKKSPFNFLFIIFLSTIFAPANGLIVLLSLIFTYILLLMVNKNFGGLRIFYITLVVASGLLITSTDNYLSYKIFSPIAASNTFWVGRLIGDKLAQPSINQICNEKNYIATTPCLYKNSYMNRGGQDFLWGSYKNNFNPWDLRYNKFFSKVKIRTLTHNPISFASDAFHAGISTLLSFPNNMSELYGRYNTTSADNWIYRTVNKYFNVSQMMGSWQQTSSSSFSYFTITNYIAVFVILLTLTSSLKRLFVLDRTFLFAFIFTFSCILFNAFVDGGLSMVNPRYNSKGFGVLCVMLVFIIASLPRKKPASPSVSFPVENSCINENN